MASGTASRQSRGPTPLPSYQPPEHPLNETAIRAIQDLPRNHRLDPLKARFKAANSHLTTAAVDANDRLQIQLVAYEKDRARREKQGSQGEHGAEERLMEEARQKTENLTGRLEGSIRKMIDARAEVEGFEHALKELQENVVEGRGHLAPTQSTLGASQFQQNRRAQRAGMDSDSESDDDAAGENGSAIDLMKRKIAEQKAAYQNSSMFHRFVFRG